MKQLDFTANKLKTDTYHAISVVNLSNNSKVVVNATSKFFIDNYKSFEGFLEYLHEVGIVHFEVTNKRKNGSTYKNDEKLPSFIVDARPQTQAKPVMEKVHTPEVVQQANPFAALLTGGLNGGLNMMDVSYKFQDYERIKSEYAELKTKCERLENENKELENHKFKSEFSNDKTNANVEMVKTLAPMLGPVIAKMMAGGGGAGGLGSPSTENLSPIKMQFIDMAKESDDEMIDNLLLISHGIGNNNAFATELYNLMINHKIIESDATN